MLAYIQNARSRCPLLKSSVLLKVIIKDSVVAIKPIQWGFLTLEQTSAGELGSGENYLGITLS